MTDFWGYFVLTVLLVIDSCIGYFTGLPFFVKRFRSMQLPM